MLASLHLRKKKEKKKELADCFQVSQSVSQSLGDSPSKGNQATTRGKENIF